MRLHGNAALTVRQRREMVRLVVKEGWSPARAAAEYKTSNKTCVKWVARYREASEAGLLDRSSACERVANRTDERRIEAIAALRRLRFTGRVCPMFCVRSGVTDAALGAGKAIHDQAEDQVQRE
jgi:hypothetical protein